MCKICRMSKYDGTIKIRWGLIAAVQIVSWTHTETVPLVEFDPTFDPRIRATPTFQSAGDYVGDDTIPGKPPRFLVKSTWLPCSDNDIMARWLVSLCPHPKPYGCFKRHNTVSSH